MRPKPTSTSLSPRRPRIGTPPHPAPAARAPRTLLTPPPTPRGFGARNVPCGGHSPPHRTSFAPNRRVPPPHPPRPPTQAPSPTPPTATPHPPPPGQARPG